MVKNYFTQSASTRLEVFKFSDTGEEPGPCGPVRSPPAALARRRNVAVLGVVAMLVYSLSLICCVRPAPRATLRSESNIELGVHSEPDADTDQPCVRNEECHTECSGLRIEGIHDAVEVASFGVGFCAWTRSGEVWCWRTGSLQYPLLEELGLAEPWPLLRH